MWLHLRDLRPQGFHFRRQSPFQGHYLDFVCFKSRLVVEVDGGGHGESIQAGHDTLRDKVLKHHGFQTLRFWNGDINTNIDGVMDTILSALAACAP